MNIRSFTLLKIPPIALVLAGLFAGFFLHIGFVSLAPALGQEQVEPSIRQTGKYSLISPLLLCPTYENNDLAQTTSLRSEIEHYIDEQVSAGKVDKVSVYVRGLKGSWLGIDENEPFAPASLLKVPLMIAYFKKAETDPSILTRVVTYDGSFDDNAKEQFRSPNELKPGNYQIIDLIQAMIENSDNNATHLLDENIDLKTLAEVYTDLGLTLPYADSPTVTIISAKQYSYFFRVLYNATYLTPEYSQKAMEFLTAPDFTQGIKAAVPQDIKVAQKFGERTVFTPAGDIVERNLHDCGIVYAKENSYLICIMTKGKDFSDLATTIQNIAKLVYNRTTEIAQ